MLAGGAGGIGASGTGVGGTRRAHGHGNGADVCDVFAVEQVVVHALFERSASV